MLAFESVLDIPFKKFFLNNLQVINNNNLISNTDEQQEPEFLSRSSTPLLLSNDSSNNAKKLEHQVRELKNEISKLRQLIENSTNPLSITVQPNPIMGK